MKQTLYKLINEINTVGFRSAIRKIIKLLTTMLGLRVSETLCYKYSFESNSEIEKMEIKINLKNINCEIIHTLDELQKSEKFTKKINSLPYKKWFNSGAVCISLIYKTKMIGYMWVHPKEYHINNMGTFISTSKDIYIGPAYIDINFRKKGLYHVLIINCLKYVKDKHIKHVYSTSNIENIKSIKTFIRCGFKVIGCVRKKSKRKKQILEFNKENLIMQRIKLQIN